MRVMRAVSGTLELGRTTAPRRAFKSVDFPARNGPAIHYNTRQMTFAPNQISVWDGLMESTSALMIHQVG